MYVSHRAGKIICVSSTPFQGSIELPNHLESLPEKTLMDNFIIRDGEIVDRDALWKQPGGLRVAFVSLYGVNCGIATYTHYLTDAMLPMVKELRVFAERCESDVLPQHVIQCWERNKGWSGLVDELENYRPDIIFVQHEYGYMKDAASWNSLMSQLQKWRTVVTLHAVYDHMDKLAFEGACREIIVHSSGAKDLLRKKGVDHCPIHVIPHGCLTNWPDESVRFSSLKEKSVIFQYGFGFDYKGWETSIALTDRLSKHFADLRYIGVFNISDYAKNSMESYHTDLLQKAKAAGISDIFSLHAGKRSEQILMSYMRQAACIVFPYCNHHEWRVHGASGAIRLALLSGTPVVLGNVPFFEEMRGVVPICSNLDEYVSEISNFIANPQAVAATRGNMKSFIESRSWEKVARWYLETSPKEEVSRP